jgi:hypothetical protein
MTDIPVPESTPNVKSEAPVQVSSLRADIDEVSARFDALQSAADELEQALIHIEEETIGAGDDVVNAANDARYRLYNSVSDIERDLQTLYETADEHAEDSSAPA